MNKLKVIGVPVLISTTIPFLVIGIIELSLFFAHKSTGWSIFASQIERYQKKRIAYPPIKADDGLLRVAIFGGSSSMGYAAPVSFGDILQQNSNKAIIHNYAQPGAPFVGFQSEKLKALLPYYDIFIVYAGHNEIHSYNYKNSLSSGQDYIYPNGNRVPAQRIAKHKSANDFNTNKAVAFQSEKIITGNLRSPEFVRDLLDMAKRILRALVPIPKDSTKADRIYPLFSEPDNSRTSAIISNFKFETEAIVKLLKPNQKLVLSTVISNDLYPPVVDSLRSDVDVNSSLSLLNQKVFKAYHAVSTSHGLGAEIPYKLIPPGAHYKYLKAVSECNLDIVNLTGFISNSCIDQLRAARASDNLPLRVLPQLNDYIRKLDGVYSNVVIVDPSKLIETSQGINSYLSYFVDFQHPSEKGHLLIASLLANDVLGLNRLNYSYSFKSCEDARNVNLDWLSKFMDISPVPHVHEYYFQLASNIKCAAQSKTDIDTSEF